MKRFLSLLLLTHLAHAGYFKERSKGWHWYQRDAGPLNKEDIPKPKPDTSKQGAPGGDNKIEDSRPTTARKKLIKIREDMEEALSVAILNPTSSNIRNFQQMQQKWVSRSEVFSNQWMRNLIEYPSLDAAAKSPTSQFGVKVRRELEQQHMEEKIRSYTKTHGLFFFYQGKCKYCQAMAPIIQMLGEKYGWKVMGITQDGVFLPEFPESKKDNGITEAWGIQGVPAVFVVQPVTEMVKPIAYGVGSLEQLEQNLVRQLEDKGDAR